MRVYIYCFASSLLFLFSTGCISLNMQGATTGNIKKQLVNSFLFKAAKRFYPNGIPDDPSVLPKLSTSQIAEIQTEFEELNDAVAAMQVRYYNLLTNQFRDLISTQIQSRVNVLEPGKLPSAHTDDDGTINIDVRVAQALFRGAVIDDYSQPDLFSKYFTDKFDPTNSPAFMEKKALEALYDDVSTIEKMKGRTELGDAYDVVVKHGTDSPFFDANDIAISDESIQSEYTGTVLFLLAHEGGHLAFGHSARLGAFTNSEAYKRMSVSEQQSAYCQMRKECEYEADSYALWLLYFANQEAVYKAEVKTRKLVLNDYSNSETTWYNAFFNYSYALSGFSEIKDNCEYPPLAERLKACDKVMASIDDYDDKTQYQPISDEIKPRKLK